MKASIECDQDNRRFEIKFSANKESAVSLMVSFEQADMIARWSNGGPTDVVLREDLIDYKFVEAIELDGKIYTKTDLRFYVEKVGAKSV